MAVTLTEASLHLSVNVVDDVRTALSYHFMVNAFRAGTVVAIVAAVVGWFMVLRRETFVGHTLAVVGFPGAAAAIWLGVSVVSGYYVFCIAAAVIVAVFPAARTHGDQHDSAGIGTLQAFALACGFLFASLYGGNINGFSTLLFGSFVGVTDAQVTALVVVATGVLVLIAAVARPLLFASIDRDVAIARGVPVRLLSFVFLVALGVGVAGASQITGSLLVFALLVVPAATAQTVTARPVLGLGLAIGLSVAITWLGLGIGFYSAYPLGFWITTIAFGTFVLAHAGRALAGALR